MKKEGRDNMAEKKVLGIVGSPHKDGGTCTGANSREMRHAATQREAA